MLVVLDTLDADSYMVLTKFASKGEKAGGFQLVEENSHASNHHIISIDHNQWATHGEKTNTNTHPHTDSYGNIAIVHNGMLNAKELLAELKSRIHVFRIQTDTKVITKIIR